MKRQKMTWGKYYPPITKDFGKLLTNWRHKTGLSGHAFANAIGLEMTNYSKIETGKMQPPRYTPVNIQVLSSLTRMSKSDMIELLALWDISRGDIPRNLNQKQLDKIKKCFKQILRG